MSSREKRMVDELSAGELRLRVLSVDDADELHAIFSDPHTHTIGEGPFEDLEQTRMWLRRRAERRAEHGVAWYGVRLPDGEFIGNAGLFIGRSGNEPELGFEIRKPDQGKGYGTQAATAVVAEAHRVGFARVWATVRPWNIASFRALARVGFIEDRTEDDERGGLTYLLHHINEGRQPVSVEQ